VSPVAEQGSFFIAYQLVVGAVLAKDFGTLTIEPLAYENISAFSYVMHVAPPI
jgi:hypothetical protein